MTKIVGIDPGLAATGVGVVSGRGMAVAGYSFGCIATSRSIPLAERLDCIFSKLQQLFSRETPDLVVIEDVFSLQEYPRSGICLGQVSGVVMLAAVRAGLRCVQIPVREAKQVLTGNGNASKLQLEKAVRGRLEHPGPIRPFHAADALGLALIGLYRFAESKRTPSASSLSGGAPPTLRRRSPACAQLTAPKRRRTP
jgi:crossover junction endodeoxyribonuclease RuvC